MKNRPNILILMADQMQGQVLEPNHPCKTPHLDALAGRGVRFRNAYTANAVCSPARASMMTGLLPHNHGVLCVTHCVDDDQLVLRTEHPHFAQSLRAAGYHTGYFGKWHVERSHNLTAFGWDVHCDEANNAWWDQVKAINAAEGPEACRNVGTLTQKGYQDQRFFWVTDRPPEKRSQGVIVSMAENYLDSALKEDGPWCCMLSLNEPHDPFCCSEEAFAQYDVDSIELPENVFDTCADKPGAYRKAARIFEQMTTQDKKVATACYWASITELDAAYGRVIEKVRAAGQLENTIVIVTSDHGEFLGAHGMYCKNIGGFEEVYHIPMIVAGPGVAQGEVSAARVGQHDLCQTILELAGCAAFDVPDSRSFAPVCMNPAEQDAAFSTGYAEYFGTRYYWTQRVVYDGQWKYLFNGFEEDELYDLANDPGEMKNLALNPAYREQLEHMTTVMWRYASRTGDKSIVNTQYPILRNAPVGPLVTAESL